ncbi:flagellar hook-associated protein FlgK [Planococcus maritimus]|uniref:flagellar hook-associated protein FlgK n=1 Tax=Planococcus maritimus TaxID=192421 RepID=UPI00084C20FF|nr:flagellar hook-associated protein FlgK [Planococcus maritimus]OED31623.1 flagellar hook-associated protein FlgK [Planococcus maritimus]
MSTFHTLETGRRGLSAGQASLSTTGHNIANANTKGYSRQQVNTSSAASLEVWTSQGKGQLGTGVSVDSVMRVRDRFLDQQYRGHTAELAEWQTKSEALGNVETILGEPGENGLNASMGRLWSAWQDLESDPSNAAVQAVVKERAQAFADVAKTIDRSMGDLKVELTDRTAAAQTEAQTLISRIEELNKHISQNGAQANDLRDARDAAVDELSQLMDIKVTEKADGSYALALASNNQPVKSGEPVELQAAGGKLGGLGQSLTTVENYQQKINTAVTEFAQANGNVFETTSPAGELSVATDAPLELPKGLDEDVKNVQADFRAIVSGLGAEGQTAGYAVSAQEQLIVSTENRRQAVTGVSLDEEMSNLVKFQHAYNAAARLVSTTDEMLDTIINRMAAR